MHDVGTVDTAVRGTQPGARRTGRTGLWCAVVIGALLSPLVSSATHARADAPAVTHDAALERMFTTYGNSGVGWTGGDGTYSIKLRDGRIAWNFSDTFLAPVNPDGSRPTSAPFIHNSYVLQIVSVPTTTLYTTNAFGKFAFINAADGQSFYWLGAQVIEGSHLYQFLIHMVAANAAYQQVGVDVATFSLPDLTLQGITASPGGYLPAHDGGYPITYGVSVAHDATYEYIYGVEDYVLNKFMHVARVPVGHLLDGTWEYYTGTAWTTTEAQSGRQVPEVADALSVVRTTTGYRMIAQYFGVGAQIQMFTADNPQFDHATGPVTVYTTPETASSTMITYNALEHPEFDTPDHIVVSYNVNASSTNPNGDYQDVSIYRARFIDVYLLSNLAVGFEPTTLTYTGHSFLRRATPATLSARLTTSGGEPIGGRDLTLGLGQGSSCTATTDATGVASCAAAGPASDGPQQVAVSFAGDPTYASSTSSAAVTAFDYLSAGSFMIGDGSAVPGAPAVFWGGRWVSTNSVTGGPPPAGFEGFARTLQSTPPAAGQIWTSSAWTGANPPRSVPSYMAVIVTSSVLRATGGATGNIVRIAVIRVDPGYGPLPRDGGTGVVLGFIDQ